MWKPRALAMLVSIVLTSTACSGPRDATPMPEPPSMDLSKLGPGVRGDGGAEVTPSTTAISLVLRGEPGFAPPRSELLVTHLDGGTAPTAISIREDGSFEDTVYGDYGDEFRFQLVVNDRRGEPVDAFYLVPATGQPYFSPSIRHDCVSLRPGFEVTFEDMGVSPLALDNDCGGEVTVANARSRTGAAGSRTSTPLPLAVPAGGSATLSLQYQGSAFGSSEDTLFFDVTLDGRAIRYPITLFAP